MFKDKRRFEIEKVSLDAQDIDEFVLSEEVDMNKLSMAFVAGGQGGGKIAAEFCRFGYPLLAYNTCTEDLDDLQEYLSKMKSCGPFVRVDLEGENGASKDRDLGLKAVKDNLQLLKKDVLANDYIYDADFVWVVVALGGGTGNGSLTSIVKLISTYVREDKKIYRGGEYKSTIGVIAAIPDETAKSKIRMNVSKALQEIEALQENGDLGAVVLVDNQKLIDDFNINYDEKRDADKTWATDGNNKVARIITELALTTSLKSSEMLDKSEMLDIWTTPGFMTIGKKELGDVWMVDTCIEEKEEDLPIEAKDIQKKRNLMADMLTKTFSEGVFVDGIDFDSAIHGGMVVISDGKTINNRDAKELERVLSSHVLNSDTIESPHFGFIRTDLTRTVKEMDKEESGQGKVFTVCVTKKASSSIKKWFEDTVDSRKKHLKALEEVQEDAGLQGLIDEVNIKPAENKKKQSVGINLDDLFGDVSKINKTNKSRRRNLDALDSLFGDIGDGSSKKEESAKDRKNNMLDQLFS